VIEGTEAKPVILTSTASTPAAGDWDGIRQTGKGELTLRHTTIEYASLGVDYQVDGEFSVSPTIENSTIRHTKGRGLYLEAKGGANLTASIENNTIYSNTEYGVYLSASESNTKLNATVSNNQVYKNKYGISLEGSSYSNTAFTATVTNNQVHDVGYQGIYIKNHSASNKVQVAENTIYNITHSWGIEVTNKSDNSRLELVNNTVSDCQYGGVYLSNSSSSSGKRVFSLIEGNTLHDNKIGLRVYNYRGTHTPLVRQNSVYNNKSNGIQFEDSESSIFQPQISLNEVHDNAGHGLSIRTKQSATVVHNSIYNNSQNAIYLTNANDVSHINFNNIYGNAGDYALHNNSSVSVDARYNWWGAASTQEMEAGNNPKDIARLFDIYDNSSKGSVDYRHWLSALQPLSKNALSWIKTPADGEKLKAATYQIKGAAIAPTGIDRVEVSADGGTTWNVASGTLHWFYEWTVPEGNGTYLIKSRVITSDGAIQTAAGNTVIIDSGLATTSGVLQADETWNDEIVKITGDLIVPEGMTLTVAPGTTVEFLALNDDMAGGHNPDRAELLIQGSLIAEGTADEPIVFTRRGAGTPAAGDWGGISQTGNGQLTLRHTTIEYASLGVDYQVEGEFTVSPTIENSIIRHTNGHGLYLSAKGGTDLTASIQNNTIHHHGKDGLYLSATGTNTLVNATVSNNQVYSNDNTGVYIKHNGGTNTALTAIVMDNEIHTNKQYGLYIYSPSGSKSAFTATVMANEIHDTRYNGIYLYNRSATNDVQIVGNTVFKINDWGIEVNNRGSSYHLEMLDNTVYGGQGGGFYFYNYSYSSETVMPRIERNTLRDNNGTGLYVYNYRGTPPHVRQNTLYNNDGNGIQFEHNSSSVFQPQITLNDVHDNGEHGLSISTDQSATVVHNSIYNNKKNGIYLLKSNDVSHINFNNIYGNKGDYALHNNSSASVDARYNWWGSTLTEKMNEGNNPKEITRLFDIYDEPKKGSVDYNHWLSGIQTLSTEPVSWITAPAEDETLKAATYRIEGVATATTDLERVEISTDGGTTWQLANGTSHWHYDWTVPSNGNEIIQSRVITTDGRPQTTPTKNRITIDHTIPNNAGILLADETWKGTVHLNGDIIIPEGVSLTLLPGTTVTIDRLLDSLHSGDDPNRIEIIVQGTLLSQGTEAEPVLITPALTPKKTSDWGGIKVTGTLEMAYTTLEYGDYGLYCESKTSATHCDVQHSTIQLMNDNGISVYADNKQTAQINISDSLIQQNGGYGIYAKVYQGSTQIQIGLNGNEVFQNKEAGIYLEAFYSASMQANVLNNKVHENTNYAVYIETITHAQSLVEVRDNQLHSTVNGDGLYFKNNYAANTSSHTITGNEIDNNRHVGLLYYNQETAISPIITHNTLHDNSDFGIHLDHRGKRAALMPTLSGNTIHSNNTGMFINATGATTLENNEFYANRVDIRNQSTYAVNAQNNWWGVDTTNLLNTGSHPRNLSNLYDHFDEATLGTVDYSNWLSNYARPQAPSLNPVSSPVAAETQTLTGTKEANTGMMINGLERVAVDAQTTWIAEITLQEGHNPITLSAFNVEGLLSEPISTQIILDTQAPRLISSTPANGALLNSQIKTIVLILHDNATAIDLAQTAASVINSQNETLYGTWTSQFNRLSFMAENALADDTYTVSLTAVDTPLGNRATVSMQFSIDTGKPQAVTLNAITSPTRTTPQVLSGTKEAGTAILINGSEVIAHNAETTWQYSLNLQEGSHDLAIVAQDSAGNHSPEVTASMTLDTKGPEVLAITPAQNTFTNQAPSTIELALFDATSGIDKTTTLDNATVQHSLKGTLSGTWTLNAEQPLIFTPDNALIDGAYTIKVDVTDLAGNVTAVNSRFTYDATAPSLFTLNPVTTPTNNKTQTLSGDKEAGNAIWINDKQAVPADNETTWRAVVTLSNGSNTFELLARDPAGNPSEVITTTIVFDEISPLPVSELTVNTANNGTTAELAWSDYDETTHGDIAGYWVFYDESLFTQTAEMIPTVKLAAGEKRYSLTGLTKGQSYYFAVVAIDENGNLNPSVTPVTATLSDIGPPEEITALQSQSFVDKLLLSWTHSVNSVGDLGGYKLYQDSTLIDTLPATTNTFELTGLTEATAYPITITAFDTDGNESSGVSLTAVTLLSNPANLVATAAYQSITLTWDAVSPASLVKNYAIYVATTDFNDVVGMTPLQRVEPDVTTTTLSNLNNGTTYYIAVTAQNQSGGEQTSVTTVSATPKADTTGPLISEIQFENSPLAEGGTISQSGTISLTANDAFGIGRVEFWLDGRLFHTDSNGSSRYTAPLQITGMNDGEHTIEIKAYDTLGQLSSTKLTVSVALAAPTATPVITQPVNRLVTNQTELTVTGTAEPGTEIILYRNGTEVGSPLSLDDRNRFSTPITLDVGQNNLQIAARNRGGTGPLSSTTWVTLDTSIPDAPSALLAQARPAGDIRLTWQATDTDIVSYDVYRASHSFTAISKAQKVNKQIVTDTVFNNLGLTDGRYYYRVVALNALGTPSAFSNEVSVYADTTGPRATKIEYSPPLTHYAQGRVEVTLTVSEPLLATPFLSLVPDGGIPIPIALTPLTETVYQGHFEITDTTLSGTAYAYFSARDIAGNRDYEIDAGQSINIDIDGPGISKITLSPPEPIRNDQTNPVIVQVDIQLNEALLVGKVPQLSYLLSGKSRLPETITPLTQTHNPLIWTASFSLPADAGLNATENLQFIFRAEDELGNVGHKISGDNAFQIYQGDLPPLDVPLGLVAIAQPGGRVQLSWEAVENAADYQIFRQAPGESDLSAYQRSGGTLKFTDISTLDGLYHYAVASVRTANTQEAISEYGKSVKVTADSVAPDAPTHFQLTLVGAGIRATWEAPAGNEALTYRLYRAENETDSSSLTVIKTGITELTAIDNAPSETQHYYTVVAIDAAGNEFPNEFPFYHFEYLNFDLLPVATLEVVQEGEKMPVVSWSHGASNLAGFDLYLGPEAERFKINATPLPDKTYIDKGYNQQERLYTVVAIDQNGVESLGRTVALPALEFELHNTLPIRRSQFNTLIYQVKNQSARPITGLSIQAQLETIGRDSDTFALSAGETKEVPVIVEGDADLAALRSLVTTLAIQPDTGEITRIIRKQNVEVSDGGLVIELQSKEMMRGKKGQVKFSLENSSPVAIEILIATASGTAASNEIRFLLQDDDENVLTRQAFQQAIGKHVITLANGKTVARIPAGERFESNWVDLPIPASAPSEVKLQLKIDNIHYHLGRKDAVSLAGIENSQRLVLLDTAYYGKITDICPETSYGDEPIVITGMAVERATSKPMRFVPLQLVITLRGFERSYQVYTDQNGAFSHTFTPLSTESGTYKVSVIHPDLTERPEQKQFVIQRIELSAGGSGSLEGSDYTVNLRIPFNYEQRIDVPVTAKGSLEKHNVHLVYEAIDQPLGYFPSGVQVNLGKALSVLNAGEPEHLSFTVSADKSAKSSGKLVLKLISDERSDTPIGRVIVNYHFSIAHPALFGSPSYIETSVTKENSVTETLTLENQGLADLTGLTVALLNEAGRPAPNWIYLTTPEKLGTLAVGEKRDVQIMASPSASVEEGNYLFILRASGDNHAPIDIYVALAVTQSGVGRILFKVADIYTATLDDQGNVIEGLAGAKIHVQNERVLTIEQTLTDKVGEALFKDLPAGRYKFKASAPNHQEVIGRFRIKPGVTVSKRVFLDYNLVTVEWSVTEITIEDRYEINLEATYETNVPAPVVLLEPLSVNLPAMQPGEVFYGELTLTNYGLIRADDLKFDLPNDQYFKYDLLDDLPISLGAKERLTIPYRITALNPLDRSTDGSGGGCQHYYQIFRVTYTYRCTDGTERQDSKTVTFLRNEGDCSVSGGNSFGNLVGLGAGGGGGASIASSSGGCVGAGCGNNPTYKPPKISPNPKPIGGVQCWPVAERWEHCRDIPVDDYLKEKFKDALYAVGCSVNSVLMEFNDDATDLRVKVPGGSIKIERLFYGNTWHWRDLSNNLKFNWNALGNYIASIDKGGVTYKLSVGSSGTVWEVPQNLVYVKDNTQIIKQDDGYRWQNKMAQWKEYDLNGRMTAFGNRQGTIGKWLYSAEAKASAIGIADRNDRQVFGFEYNQDGQLSAVRDLDNHRVEYSYTGGHLTGVKDVLGQNTLYEYDSQGYLVKKVDSGGRITQVVYDAYGHPTAVTGANGEGFFFEYDYDASKKEYYSRITTTSGRIKEVWYNKKGETKRVDINGRTLKTLQKDRRDFLITDEKGNVIRKSYDEWDNLVRIVYPDNTSESFEYEPRFNLLTRAVDRRGNITSYQYDQYDEYGNVVQKTEAVGTAAEKVTTFTYDIQNQLSTITLNGDANTKSGTTTFNYDEHGNISSITDPLGHTVEFVQYDHLGNPLEIKDARGLTWRYSYDALGRLMSKTDPLGQKTMYEYDGANNNSAVVDVAQNRFEFIYNEHNQLTKARNPFTHDSRIIYNSDKLPVQLIDEAGKSRLTEYDNEGRLKRSVDGAGNEIVQHYDETPASFVNSYQPVTIEYPTYTQHLYYDKLQRLIQTTDVVDTNTRYSIHYTYDVAGNVIAKKDEEGNITRFEYDALNRLIKITDALQAVTELTYDDRDNVIAVKDANSGVTHYKYDKNNNLLKLIRPMEEVTQYAYDAAGNQTTLRDAKGQKIRYQYDALNRLTQVDYYAATDHSTPVKTVDFSYDALGNLVSYEDGSTSATYRYDALQRKLSETVNYGSFTLSTAYEYEANGLKKAFTGPDGIKIAYEYDDNNRLSAIDIPNAGRVTYNTYKWNSPAKITLPGGSQIKLAYDPLMRLESQVTQDAAKNPITDVKYEHSPTDNITKKTTKDGEYSYQYDDAYRLTNASHPVLDAEKDAESYSYDAVGNRITAASVPEGASYNANNALIRYGEAAFEHDANGNLIKQTLGSEVRHYVYDVADRLIRVEDGNGHVIAEYAYDPFGRRLWKAVGGVKTYFGYADEGLIGEYYEKGVETKAYGYKPDSLWTSNPLFQKIDGAYYWYQNDHIGTPQKMIDNKGNLVWAANYKAFGDAQIDIALIENNLRFPGQYHDVETGLYYNWHRYYDPISGRYLSLDPDRQDHNLYAYVFNNPVRFVDPEGLHASVNTVKETYSILITEPTDKIIKAWSKASEDYDNGLYGETGNWGTQSLLRVHQTSFFIKEAVLAALSVPNPFTYTKAASRGIIDTAIDDPEYAKQLKSQADNVNDALGILYGLKSALSNSHKSNELWKGGMYHRTKLAPKFGDAFLKRGNEWLFKSAALKGDALINVYLGQEWIYKNLNNGAMSGNGAPVIQDGGNSCQ